MSQPTLKLIHPELGLVNQREINRQKFTRPIIEEMWKKKYGKKFFECTIELDGQEPIIGQAKERIKQNVIFIETGKSYPTFEAAVKATGVPLSTIQIHCYRKMKPNFEYKFRFSNKLKTIKK